MGMEGRRVNGIVQGRCGEVLSSRFDNTHIDFLTFFEVLRDW